MGWASHCLLKRDRQKMDCTYHHVAALLLFTLSPNCRWFEDTVEEGDLFIVDHPGPDIFLDTCRSVLEILHKGLNMVQPFYADSVLEGRHSAGHLCKG